jgi:ABC-2 type transport system permease protein
MLVAYVAAAMLRAIIVGSLVYAVALWFTWFPLQNWAWALFFALFVTATLALLGMIAALWAEKFDHLAIFPNFVLLPLAFLGGVFYSIDLLPEPWHTISRLNPLLYMVNGLRFGFLGVADVSPMASAVVVVASFLVLLGTTAMLLRRGYNLRS